MAEIPPQEYLKMANQAYVVAYVTGLVHPARPPSFRILNPPPQPFVRRPFCTTMPSPSEKRQEPTPTVPRSVADHLPASTGHKNVDVSFPHLPPTRRILTSSHSLRFSIPKCLFLINRYVVMPMLVCVCDYPPRL